jgi:hypothetical protein
MGLVNNISNHFQLIPTKQRFRPHFSSLDLQRVSCSIFPTLLKTASLLFRFRAALTLFIVGLVLSGVTAFPLLHELRLLASLLGADSAASPEGAIGLTRWILIVRNGLEDTYAHYPWIAYGTDWLAFAHLVIAAFFIGPLIHPATSRATLYTGIVACMAVVPLAMICGSIRGIPFYWRLIDCSFGVIGIIPLIYCLKLLKRMEKADHEGAGKKAQ